MERFEFRVLGPLEVSKDGEPLALGGARQRALLALLLLSEGRAVSRERIVDALWGESPPATAANAIQVAVHGLRKIVGPERVQTQGTGYRLALEPGELDLDRFEELAETARHEPAESAAATLREALGLRRGPLLADLSDIAFVPAERDRVEDLVLLALERRIDADLELGRHGELAAELEGLVAEHPYREALRSQLMLALYRAGRQADALEAYRSARATLVEELGVEPSRSLQELEAAILRQDPALDVPQRAELGMAGAIPVAPRPLIGRDLELAAVAALVRAPDHRLVTLTGPGGTGKTRLALEAAHVLRTDFAGNVFFVDLSPLREPALVAPSAARALGVLDASDDSVVERIATAVPDRDTLLVVDNFEHLLDAAPFVAELVARVPHLQVLATSREPLRVRAEHEYRVPPLGLPGRAARELDVASRSAAVELFVARARAARSDFALTEANVSEVVDICHSLDGLPLALELAAARVKLLSPAALRDRLADRLGVLAEGDRDLPDRQRTLRSTLDWSYDLLDPGEQRLLARLGVFAGGWTLEAAEHVAGAELSTLGSLVEKSLVTTEHDTAGEPRFSMLETVREYALERLAHDGDTGETRDRHSEYFAGFAERLEPQLYVPEALDEAEREHDNIRAALTHAQSTGQLELLLRLCAIARLWYVRGYGSEGRAWTEEALGSQAGPLRRRAVTLGWAANLAWTQGDYEGSIARAQESLVLNREVGDELAEFRALGMLGLAHFSSGDAEGGREFHTQSLELARALGWEREIALALSNLAEIAAVLGDHAEARRLSSESIELSRHVSNAEPSTASASLQIAVSALEGHDEDEALPLILESLRIVRDLDFKDFIASTLVAYSRAMLEKDTALAARALGAAGAIRAHLGPPAFHFEPEMYARSHERVHELLGEEAARELEAGARAPDRVVAEILA